MNSVPAFAVSQLSGAFSLGIVFCVDALMRSESKGVADTLIDGVGLGILFALISVPLTPIFAFAFFPVVALLRCLKLVYWQSFLISGAVVCGFLELWFTDTREINRFTWSMAAAGSIGGVFGFLVIQRYSRRDADCT